MTSNGFLVNVSNDSIDFIAEKVTDICVAPGSSENSSSSLFVVIFEDGSSQILDANNEQVTLMGHLEPKAVLEQPRFVSCASGSDHLVLLDSLDSVWTQGARIQSGQFTQQLAQHEKNEPVQLELLDFFSGVQVLDIWAGSDFSVALVQRLYGQETLKPEQNSGTRLLSCPLGLPLSKTEARTEDSMETSQVMLRKNQKGKKNRKSDNSNSIVEESEKKSEQENVTNKQESDEQKVERLAKVQKSHTLINFKNELTGNCS